MTNVEAAVVVDTALSNVINVAATTGNGTVSAGNGTNRLMVLGCTTEYGTAGPSTYTINANYGGQTFTTIASNGSQRQTAWIGYINETKIAAASNTTLTATISQTTNARDLMCGVVVYENVDQGTPIAGSNAQASGGATSLTFTNIPSTADGYAVYIAGHNGGTATAPGGFTEAFDVASGQSNGSGGDGATAASTVTGTVTFSANSRCALAMATVNPYVPTDSTPPTVGTVTITSPAANTATYVPANVTFSAAITESQSTPTCQYTTNGSTWSAGVISGASSPYTCTATVTGLTGAVTLNIRASSLGGGPTTGTALSRTVDATAPTTTAAPAAGTYTSDQNVTLTPSDAGVGVASTVYCVDTTNSCVPATAYTVAVAVTGTVDTSVVKYLRYASTDNFGNAETVKSETYTLNRAVAPTITAFTVPATVIDTAAPLDIPITTFTATDNVAVTGYMITESATAPLAGAAGWSATAPTSYTVAVYGSYTLYAWAKDAAGNVSLSASATVNVINCTPGTITVTGLPAAISGDINFSTYVTLNSTADSTVSNGQFSVDGGALAALGIYSPPANSKGTLSVAFQAVDSCSGAPVFASGNPYAISYDTRTNGTVAGTASASQSGLTAITVTMPYQGDKDSNATFQVDYMWDGDSVWHNGTAQTDTDNTSPYTQVLSGLNSTGTYQIRVTYADSPLSGTAVQTKNVTMVAWTDSQLLHNSLRFACSVLAADGSTITTAGACTTAGGTWNEDRRHAGGWGTGSSSAYGAILCSTCHAKNSGNIKRVTKQVGLAGIPGALETTITYSSAEEGTSDLGSTSTDNLSHTTSNRICEVCHTYSATDPGVTTPTNGVRFHAYNMSATTENHAVDGDCIQCHEHKVGFRASCASCHGNPPETGKLVSKASSGPLTTGSTTAGAHLTHVNVQKIDCALCHAGSVGGGATHNTNGTVTLTFANLPTGTGGVNGGSYDGQTTVTYDTTDAVNTTLTKTGTKTCANYCHGSTIAGTSPAWDGAVVCGTCHAVTAATVNTLPSGTSHATHVGQGKDCSFCHGTGYTNVSGSEAAPAGHVDGAIEYNVSAIGASTTYSGAASGTIANTAPSGTYGNCANVSCHGNAVPGPQWNNAASVVCGSCHGTAGTYNDARDGAPTSAQTNEGKHAAHLAVSNSLTGNYCNLCHNGAGSGTAKHADSTVDFAFDTTVAGAGATYTGGATPSCSGLNAANCHAGTASWSPTATIACTQCHTGTGTGARAVGSTSSHTLVTTGGTFGDCKNCHGGHYGTAGGVDIPNNTTVGINYGHGGIKLGGTGTATNINGVATADLDTQTTEAQMCWTCHDAQTVKVSEWGTNNAQTGSPVATQYNYGTLSTSNWTTATWTSAKTAFAYKTGAIQSTHSVNSAGTSAVSGPNYAKTETKDAVANIRCSYCHDVHDTATAIAGDVSGKPYLRGTWYSNPYEEDGAPQNGTAYNNISEYGAVPRGGQNATTQQRTLGGFWIDANNVRPGTATTTALSGTAYANPTTGWTLSASAGLCTLCHGTDVDNMDQTTGESLWLGTNGHSNAVIGGTGSAAANIFNLRGGNTGTGTNMANPAMHFSGASAPGDNGNYGWRNGGTSRAANYTPCINPCASESTRPYSVNLWGTLTIDANTVNTQYHKFSCSKCHNPHASRLPKLMITNCLDTKHNTWDDSYQLNTATGATASVNMSMSNWTSSQNCHRVGGIADGTGPEPVDPGAAAAPMGTGTDYKNRGWNVVTPWK
ncbi:hypothetical protein JCM30471_17680 [Desulfuromonas carbonis]